MSPREGVLARLLHAQTLLPGGLRLLFVEGYRPPRLQRSYFEEYETRLTGPWPRGHRAPCTRRRNRGSGSGR
ncbi:hypothetical protein GCM10010277_31190 [Streptomyces longisporoflavus]|nr:hypothetical protein GCM10010277_31190 [Streptomyces longisporoflavus]